MVALAAAQAAIAATGGSMKRTRVGIVGAGSAGTGIAGMLVGAGLPPEQLFMVDAQGLLHDRRGDLADYQRPFAQRWQSVEGWANHEGPTPLDAVADAVTPTVLVGVSGQPGLFTEAIVRSLAEANDHPVVLPLSNPTDRAEATPGDVLRWTDGRALIATGSPFADVEIDGRVRSVSQANNPHRVGRGPDRPRRGCRRGDRRRRTRRPEPGGVVVGGLSPDRGHMTGGDGEGSDIPANQFLAPELVMTEMAEVGAQRAVNRSASEVLLLSVLAGGFITIGAVFSTVIATGSDNEGVVRLLEGFGFSVGFFLVVLTGTLLFTEVNVEMPATLFGSGWRALGPRVARLWLLAAVGNMIGAFLTGLAVSAAEEFTPGSQELLAEIVDAKMRYREVGGVEGWLQAVLSGVLGNWLVGMAAFLAVMGRTIIGKYIPVFLLVTAFVAIGFLHSPANMAYFSLAAPAGIGPGWGPAFFWSILPAAVGNVLGAFFLVALPFWYVNSRRSASAPDAA